MAEVLSENAPMLKVFDRSGLDLSTKREPGVVQGAAAGLTDSIGIHALTRRFGAAPALR